MTTIGQALAQNLQDRHVDVVFGIPGVHTIELYRGLEGSTIRHVTSRHEQGAGFMADGYARVSGKPGVAFVITGPGLTNTLTPMAQARAESVPMLVVTGVNKTKSLGKGLGLLHELPNQQALAAQVALTSQQVNNANALGPALNTAFAAFQGRPGPAHIEVPTDIMALRAPDTVDIQPPAARPDFDLASVVDRLNSSNRPVILIGGGAKTTEASLCQLAERLDAPVIQTCNGRGVMHAHPLIVPASPSLRAVRDLLSGADVVLALGTEFGPTDYDMYALGGLPDCPGLIRIDISAAQLQRHPADLTVQADLNDALPALVPQITPRSSDGALRAQTCRNAALAEADQVGQGYAELIGQLNVLRDAIPGAYLVGDSTQAVYAGNLYYDHDRPGGWFNGATGFGALGYAIPAANGAAIAAPGTPVVALMGDGGAQFTLPEIGVAVDENLPVLFVIWNNAAFLEIANTMQSAGITATGCHPSPPNFEHVAASYNLPYVKTSPDQLQHDLTSLLPLNSPALLEIDVTPHASHA